MKKGKSKGSVNTNFKMYMIAGVISVILAIGIFFFLTMSEKTILDGAEARTVFVAKEDIPSGTVLNNTKYFKQLTINEKAVPKNAITNLKDIKGNYALVNIGENTIITDAMTKSPKKDLAGDKMIGFSCGDLPTSVNGIIRTSDYIDIYILSDEDDSQNQTIMTDEKGNVVTENAEGFNTTARPAFTRVYVSSAFDENGKLIVNSDDTSIAKNFNIVVNEEDADIIVNAINNKSIYIVKNIDGNKKATKVTTKTTDSSKKAVESEKENSEVNPEIKTVETTNALTVEQ